MKTRFLPACLACFFALSLCVTASAAGAALHILSPEGAVAEGESFLVTVELEDNPGVAALQFTLQYDQEKMTCESAKGGSILQPMMYIANPQADTGAIVAAAASQEMDEDGELALFKFTALTDLQSVDLSLTDVVFTNLDGETISVSSEQDSTELVEPDEQTFADVREDGGDVGTGEYDLDVDALFAEWDAQEAAAANGETLPGEGTAATPGDQPAGADGQAEGTEGAASDGAESEDTSAGSGSPAAQSGESEEAADAQSGTSPVLWIVGVIVIAAAAFAGVRMRKKRDAGGPKA